MIEVDPSSLRLLDSPLLQRLRGVKQLGFSYLTYPSAEHTRFIHSLGMFCVVTRFIAIIARERTERSDLPYEPFTYWQPTAEYIQLLAHAAILHDVGHMPFSHVSESIMHDNRWEFKCGGVTVDDFLIEAEDALGISPKLAECLSLAIVLSPRFGRFYRQWVNPGASEAEVRKLAALIAGVAPDEGLTGLANVISGKSIDATRSIISNATPRPAASRSELMLRVSSCGRAFSPLNQTSSSDLEIYPVSLRSEKSSSL